MNAAPGTLVAAVPGPPPGRRADAGSVRLGGRDVAGLLLCGDMYGAQGRDHPAPGPARPASGTAAPPA